MNEWARVFTEQIAAGAGGVGVALIAALIVLALLQITVPTLRNLWRKATPVGRVIGAVLFLVCSINATTKAPRRVPARSGVSVGKSHSERFENWFRRGAWRDVRFVKFDPDWVFPLGTNHLTGVWIHSWGEVAQATMPRETFAALGQELAHFPEESEVIWERTPSNSYRVAWQNAFPDRRSRENAMDAAIELFRNGDIAITTNNITRHISRELPFACAGRGQDTDWVAANYPNATGDFAAWVDNQVGVSLENGLFRFTATFPSVPEETIELFVGSYTVAVTNAGEYVFLLEKGRDYSFGTRPFLPDVTYAAVDDIGGNREAKVANRVPQMYVSTWDEVGGFLSLILPRADSEGFCCWLPRFRGSPNDPSWGPGSPAQTFRAEWIDCASTAGVTYEWKSPSGNLAIIDPYKEETKVCWLDFAKDVELSVTARIGKHNLTSSFACHIISEKVEEAVLTLAAPQALILANQGGDTSGIGELVLAFSSPYATNGVIRLTCTTGDHVEVEGLEGGASREWPAASFSNFVARLIPKTASSAVGDVQFHATFEPEEGEALEAEANLTVVEVEDLSLGADTAQGIALLRRKPFLANVKIVPADARLLVRIDWQTRQLLRSGSYGNWETCAFVRPSEPDAIFTPLAGGIYQLQVVVSDGVGGEATRAYLWNTSEGKKIGRRQKGDPKAIGIADEQWQLDLLNCARSFLGKTGYGRDEECPGQYGFATVPAKAWKCNIFVAYRACQVGLKVPAMHKRRLIFDLPPLANDWAGSCTIEGWAHAQDNPQPGWIIAHPSYPGSGHVGITDFDGVGVAAGKDIVTRRYEKWQDGTSVYRRKE